MQEFGITKKQRLLAILFELLSCAMTIGRLQAATFFADKYVKHDGFLLLVK